MLTHIQPRPSSATPSPRFRTSSKDFKSESPITACSHLDYKIEEELQYQKLQNQLDLFASIAHGPTPEQFRKLLRCHGLSHLNENKEIIISDDKTNFQENDNGLLEIT
jgi:hypothetical protein